MIKEVFFPEKLHGYYIFPKRILGFDIGKTKVQASQIYLNGSTITIEKSFEEKLEIYDVGSYTEKVIKSIKNILQKADHYDTLNTALSSSFILFKELKLPFLSYEKLKMVVDYEVEPLLPFPINDATIDFIITKQYQEEGASEVLVAAVQHQYIEQHLHLFEQAGANPNKITVDLFALYGLYKKIPSYSELRGDVALIDLGVYSTRIAFIQNKRLRFIRTLPKGSFHIAKKISELLGMSPTESMEHIIRFGVEQSDNLKFMEATKKAVLSSWKEIQFTLHSFITQSQPKEHVKKIILLGGGSEIKGITEFIRHELQIPCELFSATKLLENSKILFKSKVSISASALISLSTAMPSHETEMFNLRKGVFSLHDSTIFKKQSFFSVVLIFMLFSSLFIHTFLQIRKLKQEEITSKQELVAMLKNVFKNIPPDENDLEDILEYANREVTKKEKMFAFSNRAESSYLQYLFELTTRVDKEGLGLMLDKITIMDDMMILKGQVRDYEAVKLLVKELSSSELFAQVEKQEDKQFKAMRITLGKSRENE